MAGFWRARCQPYPQSRESNPRYSLCHHRHLYQESLRGWTRIIRETYMERERPSDDVHGEVERGQRDKPWQRYLDATLGLRNYWYPVLFSHELPEGETRPET